MMAIASGLVWWGLLLTVSAFAWIDGDVILIGATGLAILSSAVMTLLVATRWSSLTLIADDQAIRFGVRKIPRAQVSVIRIGPAAKTAAQFWSGVLLMAIAQDLSRKVYFLSRDGRELLEVSDLYGAAQLTAFASFLAVPLAGDERRA